MSEREVNKALHVVIDDLGDEKLELEEEEKKGAGDVIVIVGAGVVGACIAYFLSKKGYKPIIVERTGIACAASGKAGGFLARDWNDGALGSLSRLGFELHSQLADEFDNPWEYRRVNTISVQHNASKNKRVECKAAPWLTGATSKHTVLGTTETTAQVTPSKFTLKLVEEALRNGGKLQKGIVTKLLFGDKEGSKIVCGVVLDDGTEVVGDKVIVAAGPWSNQLASWGIPDAPEIHNNKAFSIIMKPVTSTIDNTAIFIHHISPDIGMESPEIYPRPDGTVYVVGGGDNTPLPDNPMDIHLSNDHAEKLFKFATTMCSELKQCKPHAKQACYLPFSPDALPLIGAVSKYPNLILATGHSCWGILHGPSTGLLVSEIINGDKPSVNPAPFSPDRFF
eukprot:m.88416 g.88416  ORF g.88416 m.88416 type:complete len:395 (-) comp8807_c0_seq2:775-1959(-)